MANVNLKTDFKDGDKLFAQQLNNNFGAIKAALEAMNKIVWQDDPDDMVSTFRGTTEEINSRDVIDGQLLYDTTTGETYIDYGSQRISTGSGNAIFIGDTEPSNPSTQLWINPDEPVQTIGTEVVNSLEGDEGDKAPSVHIIKSINTYSTDEVKTGYTWIDGKPIYRRIVQGIYPDASVTDWTDIITISNLDTLVNLHGAHTSNTDKNPIPRYESSNFYVQFSLSGTGILRYKQVGYNDKSWILIIEYTKTTD